ncbi:MAG: response regulator, partial [SAR202 cluster bacterium]|nr:response regulator [SAR202 cluster bacterium]
MHETAAIRALIVEDDPGDARLLSERLTAIPDMRFETVHVTTAVEAHAALTASSYDIALIDLDLPDATGLESLEKALAARPGQPIIVIIPAGDTHDPDPDALGARAIAAGAQDYLPRDLAPTRLLRAAVHFAIQRHRLQQEMERVQRQLAKLEALTETTIALGHHLRNTITPMVVLSEMVHSNDEKGLDGFVKAVRKASSD